MSFRRRLTPRNSGENARAILGSIDQQARCLREEILPQLKSAGLSLIPFGSLSRHEKKVLTDYFMEKVYPILTPLAVDPVNPFPYNSPLSVNHWADGPRAERG
jgi:polyphosphate kinase